MIKFVLILCASLCFAPLAEVEINGFKGFLCRFPVAEDASVEEITRLALKELDWDPEFTKLLYGTSHFSEFPEDMGEKLTLTAVQQSTLEVVKDEESKNGVIILKGGSKIYLDLEPGAYLMQDLTAREVVYHFEETQIEARFDYRVFKLMDCAKVVHDAVEPIQQKAEHALRSMNHLCQIRLFLLRQGVTCAEIWVSNLSPNAEALVQEKLEQLKQKCAFRDDETIQYKLREQHMNGFDFFQPVISVGNLDFRLSFRPLEDIEEGVKSFEEISCLCLKTGLKLSRVEDINTGLTLQAAPVADNDTHLTPEIIESYRACFELLNARQVFDKTLQLFLKDHIDPYIDFCFVNG